MSAIGTKQTSPSALHMSAIGGKADIISGISGHQEMSAYDPKRTSAMINIEAG
jgi:hypothetical protein